MRRTFARLLSYLRRSLVNRSSIVRICRIRGALSVVVVLSAVWTMSVTASAATFFALDKNGDPITGTAEFTAAGDEVTVRLVNTTTETHDVGDLLTSLDFMLNGPPPTLLSVTGNTRVIHVDGTFSDSSSAKALS